jgi:hypothetical protein
MRDDDNLQATNDHGMTRGLLARVTTASTRYLLPVAILTQCRGIPQFPFVDTIRVRVERAGHSRMAVARNFFLVRLSNSAVRVRF